MELSLSLLSLVMVRFLKNLNPYVLLNTAGDIQYAYTKRKFANS